MSEIVYSIVKKNRDEKYTHEAGESFDNINTLTANFLQELITDQGSSMFDKTYGTTFLRDLGQQVNIHKVRYLLDKNYETTRVKYGILSIETNNVGFNKSNGFLEMDISIIFPRGKISTSTAFKYGGSFTTKTIIEVEK